MDPQPKNNSCRDPQSKFCGVPIILSYYYDIIYLYYDKQVSPNYCSTLFYRSLLLLWSRYDILESIERHPTGDIYAIPRNLIFCAPRDFDLQSYRFKFPTPWTPICVKNQCTVIALKVFLSYSNCTHLLGNRGPLIYLFLALPGIAISGQVRRPLVLHQWLLSTQFKSTNLTRSVRETFP